MKPNFKNKLIAACAVALVLIPAPSFAETQWERSYREMGAMAVQQQREQDRLWANGATKGVSTGSALAAAALFLWLTAVLSDRPTASRTR